MRTTITLDDDVAAGIVEAQARLRATFKHTVNELLRDALTRPAKPARKFRMTVKPRPMGLNPKYNFDSTSKLLQQLDDEEGRWRTW